MLYCPLGVNLTMVFVSAVVGMIFGGIWYSLLFGKAWAQSLGKTKGQLGNPWIGMAVMFVSLIVMALSLSLLMIFIDVVKVSGGIKLGIVAGIGFVAVAMLTNDVYEKRPMKLFLINAGYQVFSIIIMSAILAYFR